MKTNPTQFKGTIIKMEWNGTGNVASTILITRSEGFVLYSTATRPLGGRVRRRNGLKCSPHNFKWSRIFNFRSTVLKNYCSLAEPCPRIASTSLQFVFLGASLLMGNSENGQFIRRKWRIGLDSFQVNAVF